ncbi:MAG: flagellar brake protein [Burkholderiales bacterium]|nr:MAG: flagellar brake protein [Burkholderiales bacterium]
MPLGTGPEHDPDVFERFGIPDTAERVRLLRALAESGEMVTLHAPRPTDGQVVSRVLALDAAHGTIDLEFTTDDARRDVFRAADAAVAVALLHRVKLQFELARFTIVGDGDRGRLRAPLPQRLARLQRRDAYRVEPTPSASPRLWLNDGHGERAVRILDVSATGLAFEWPDAGTPPQPGTRLGGSRLELPATAPIRCELVVRATEPIADPYSDPTERVPLRVGCAFEALEPSAARAVQVFVNLAQSRGRKARPRLI